MAASSDELKATLAREFPISLKEIDPIIDRIHSRYPYLDRYEIVIIVKSFFESMRFLLLSGETISINTFTSNMRLLTFHKFIKGGKKLFSKVKLSTPRKMKNGG